MCPATDTGKVLNPMRVILEGKANLEANGMEILTGAPFRLPGEGRRPHVCKCALIGEGEGARVRPEAIWDCTTCGACVQKCPVFIEQFPKLLKMRRHLVMEKADFPPELITLFENVEQRSNPYGIAPADRDRWAEGMSIPLASPRDTSADISFSRAACLPLIRG